MTGVGGYSIITRLKFLHKFYAHTKYAIMKTYLFKRETIKNNHYTSSFNESNLHKCIIVAYLFKITAYFRKYVHIFYKIIAYFCENNCIF